MDKKRENRITRRKKNKYNTVDDEVDDDVVSFWFFDGFWGDQDGGFWGEGKCFFDCYGDGFGNFTGGGYDGGKNGADVSRD